VVLLDAPRAGGAHTELGEAVPPRAVSYEPGYSGLERALQQLVSILPLTGSASQLPLFTEPQLGENSVIAGVALVNVIVLNAASEQIPRSVRQVL